MLLKNEHVGRHNGCGHNKLFLKMGTKGHTIGLQSFIKFPCFVLELQRRSTLCPPPPRDSNAKKPWGNRVKPIPECSGQVSKAPKEFQLWCRRRQNSKYFPVSSNLKNVVVLCGTNNLLLDASKDIADGILEIARSFEINYSCVNVIICGILSRDDSYL